MWSNPKFTVFITKFIFFMTYYTNFIICFIVFNFWIIIFITVYFFSFSYPFFCSIPNVSLFCWTISAIMIWINKNCWFSFKVSITFVTMKCYWCTIINIFTFVIWKLIVYLFIDLFKSNIKLQRFFNFWNNILINLYFFFFKFNCSKARTTTIFWC